MTALQAMGSHGGWPMNIFLTPALAPFYGGTYFPPQPRHGLPAFAELLLAVAEAWRERRAEIEQQAQALLAHVREGTRLPPRPTAADLHAGAVAALSRSFDPAHGGFGGAPKFPQPPLLQYLLALAWLGDGQAQAMLTTTLRNMALGGIYDHVGGGFARYSTDERWHVPHFEKMLYDNVQLVRVYVGAFRLTGEEHFRFVAEDTLAYLAREMHPAAAPWAFSSAQDADSEGVEGKFYVWTADELRAVLGPDAEAALRLYGATEAGNWEHGVNVLERRDPDGARAALGLSPEGFAAWERSLREPLYAVRARRIRPITDDKVLADWNGMALRALAEAGRLLGRADLVDAARSLAGFLLGAMRRDGRLRHAWRNGTLRDESYLADYAQVGLGLLELHAAGGEIEWLQGAHDLAEAMVGRFHVEGDGFYDGEPGVLPVRARDAFDGATPSGTAAACELLLRLSGVYERGDWAGIAWQSIERQSEILERAPSASPALLAAQLLGAHGADLALPAPAGTLDAARGEFAPLVTIVSGAADAVPLLRGRRPGEAYLCRQGACQLPAATIEALRRQLAGLRFETGR
jgi:hypothetical protein